MPRAQLLQELEPYMQQALDAVDVLREEDRRRQAALEDMIFGFRRARQSYPIYRSKVLVISEMKYSMFILAIASM